MSAAIESAVAVLQKGGIIAYPTEAVFGLGCDPDNEVILKRLLRLKLRPVDKGLIIVAASFDQLLPYIRPLTDKQKHKLDSTWPGSVTWLLPVSDSVSGLLCGKHKTIAARVTAHPIASTLCQRYGKPIVSTSANLSGQAPARSAKEVKMQFKDQIDFIVDGEVDLEANPSEIRDILTGKITRKV